MAAPAPAEEPPRRQQSLGISGYWNLMKDGYEQLVQAIIRPPKAEYEIADLGPTRFSYGGVDFVREDMQVRNPRGLLLDASLWRPLTMPEEGKPCVMWLQREESNPHLAARASPADQEIDTSHPGTCMATLRAARRR